MLVSFQNIGIGDKTVAATWSELGKVDIWDLTGHLKTVNAESSDSQGKLDTPPVFSFAGHLSEGFAVDWSPVSPGKETARVLPTNIELEMKK